MCVLPERLDNDAILDGALVWAGVRTARRSQNNLVGVLGMGMGMMHVAALTSTARRGHYFNYWLDISLFVSTNNVYTYQRMQVFGLGVTTATGSVGGVISGTTVTDSFGGSSSTTPLVAGGVAATKFSSHEQGKLNHWAPRLSAAG